MLKFLFLNFYLLNNNLYNKIIILFYFYIIYIIIIIYFYFINILLNIIKNFCYLFILINYIKFKSKKKLIYKQFNVKYNIKNNFNQVILVY